MNKEFEVHILNEEGKKREKEIAVAFDELLTKVTFLACDLGDGCSLPQSRNLYIARNKLEEACFFVKKEMAGNFSE